MERVWKDPGRPSPFHYYTLTRSGQGFIWQPLSCPSCPSCPWHRLWKGEMGASEKLLPSHTSHVESLSPPQLLTSPKSKP